MKAMDDWSKTAKNLAESHVEWFLAMIRPLLIEHMIHGFKHGMEYREEGGGISYGNTMD